MAEKTTEGKEMSFLDHLEELRWHIIRSLGALVVFAILAFLFKNIIFDKIILAPKMPEFWTNRMMARAADFLHMPALKINQDPFQIINISMAGQFTTHIKVSLSVGLILGFPYLIYELWKFISPALYENERKNSRGGLFYTSLLFFMGVLFGYFLIVPLSVHFLGGYHVSDQVQNQINLQSYIGTVTSVVLAAGLIFELPVLIYFLSKIGIVTPQWLKKYRRHAIVVTLLVAAIITPPDIFSQVLVCLPLIVLYEAGIVISRRVNKKREAI
ncbi:twin-arginine translocase subunit TatC [Saccharicrinis sp. FJH2]|uniref:twin-arginine translocase subunit TatC n=1 Tax=Saccharicrinis sp. FJH65 TaxID=3344659 RepID=UPI0035F4BD75